MATLAAIRRALQSNQPVISSDPKAKKAAVACILRETDEGPQILFILRSRRMDDPWSGNIAFPGGIIDPGDRSPRETAERETQEEIGLDLSQFEYLGRLDDVIANIIAVQVFGFVYYVEDPEPFTLSDEVQESFWVSISDLVDPNRRIAFPFQRIGEEKRRFPAIAILETDKPVLWGITYRFVAKFLNLLDYQLPLSI